MGSSSEPKSRDLSVTAYSLLSRPGRGKRHRALWAAECPRPRKQADDLGGHQERIGQPYHGPHRYESANRVSDHLSRDLNADSRANEQEKAVGVSVPEQCSPQQEIEDFFRKAQISAHRSHPHIDTWILEGQNGTDGDASHRYWKDPTGKPLEIGASPQTFADER